MTLYQAGRSAYGGSTNVWGGWTFRRKPEDFFLKTNTGRGLDWPFDYDTLEPYYCQAEDYLAVSGDSKDASVPRSRPYPFHEFPYSYVDQPVARAMEKLGISYAHLPIARRGVSKVPSTHAPCQVTGTCDYCPFGARFVACDYMDDFRRWNDYPNLEIKLGAVVMTIRMATKRRAAGVVYKETATRRDDQRRRRPGHRGRGDVRVAQAPPAIDVEGLARRHRQRHRQRRPVPHHPSLHDLRRLAAG